MKCNALYLALITFSFLTCTKKEVPIVVPKAKLQLSFTPFFVEQQFGKSDFRISFKFNIDSVIIDELGFYWSSKNSTPTQKDNKISDFGIKNLNNFIGFSKNLTNLSSDSTYYFKPFLTINKTVYEAQENQVFSFKPLKCKIETVEPSFKTLATLPLGFDFRKNNVVCGNSLCLVNSIGNIAKYDKNANIWGFDKQVYFNFAAEFNRFDSYNDLQTFTINGKTYAGLGIKNYETKTSNQFFEFDENSKNWKALTPVEFDQQQSYNQWLITDSTAIFITFPENTLWEYKPSKNTFQKLYVIKDLVPLETPKHIQYKDKVIFITKAIYEEQYSIYSFDFSTKSVSKITTIESLCSNNLFVGNIEKLIIRNNSLYFAGYSEGRPNYYIFGLPYRHYDLELKQWRTPINSYGENNLLQFGNSFLTYKQKIYTFKYLGSDTFFTEVILPE